MRREEKLDLMRGHYQNDYGSTNFKNPSYDIRGESFIDPSMEDSDDKLDLMRDDKLDLMRDRFNKVFDLDSIDVINENSPDLPGFELPGITNLFRE
jgi:hypothetical protein